MKEGKGTFVSGWQFVNESESFEEVKVWSAGRADLGAKVKQPQDGRAELEGERFLGAYSEPTTTRSLAFWKAIRLTSVCVCVYVG